MSQTHRNPSKFWQKQVTNLRPKPRWKYKLGLPTGRRSRDRGRERSERLPKQFLLWTGAGCEVALSMCILWRRSYNHKNLQSDCWDTNDGINPANQLISSSSHCFQGFIIPGGAGFLPSTVSCCHHRWRLPSFSSSTAKSCITSIWIISIILSLKSWFLAVMKNPFRNSDPCIITGQ